MISHIWRNYPSTTGFVLLTDKLLFLNRGYIETFLPVKIMEWSKFIDYFGLRIGADPYRSANNNVYFVHIGSIPSPSSVQIHIEILHLKKYFNLEPPKLLLYQHTINNSSGTMTHVSSSLRSLGVIYINFFSLVVSNW